MPNEQLVSDIERRNAGECRADLTEDRKIRGLAIAFNKPSENLGGFREVIYPEAVDRTLREAIDVRALVDHETAKVLGRITAGTLLMRKQTKGLTVEIDPPATTYARDILESVSRGDVSGMSFAFRVMPGGENWIEDEDGFPLREIYDMRIQEVSIVTFPAYPQTNVALARRSLERHLATRRNTTKWREQFQEIQRIKLGLHG